MVSRYSFFIFYFSASFLPILAWCHLVVFFKLAVEVGQVIKACLAGDFQNREVRVLQEFGRLAQAELDQVLNAGNAQMLLEEVHEMVGTVAANAGQLVNIQVFLVMGIDVVDDGANLFFLAIAFG